MPQTTGRFFDELAKMMTNAAGAAQGMRGEFDTLLRSQAERLMREYDLVQRDEFDAVKAMAEKARIENEDMKARLEALEARLAE